MILALRYYFCMIRIDYCVRFVESLNDTNLQTIWFPTLEQCVDYARVNDLIPVQFCKLETVEILTPGPDNPMSNYDLN